MAGVKFEIGDIVKMTSHTLGDKFVDEVISQEVFLELNSEEEEWDEDSVLYTKQLLPEIDELKGVYQWTEDQIETWSMELDEQYAKEKNVKEEVEEWLK